MCGSAPVEQTAWYVAGHAVARALLGYRFRSATTQPRRLEEGLTVTGWVDAATDTAARAREFGHGWVHFEAVVMALAGWTALTLAEADAPHSSETALTRDHVAYLIDEQLALRNVRLLAEMYAHGAEQAIYAQGIHATRAILSLPTVHTAIQAVARALLRHETLAGDQVITVIAATIAPDDIRRARHMIEATVERWGESW